MASEALKTKVAERAAAPAKAGPTILDLLERQKPQIERALPRGMDADRFTRIVLTECKRTPKLMLCTSSSLLGACMVSAQLGLEPGPLGHSYLVPFANRKTGNLEVTLIIGYKGYIDLARRSGNIASIVAREVCEGDHFEFEYGLDERLVHKPSLTERGKVIAYYGIAKYVDGGHTVMVMSPADIEKRRARSKAKDDGPWKTDYDAMAKKTVVRAMASFLPLSIEAARAVASDEGVVRHEDLKPDMSDVIDVESEEIEPDPEPPTDEPPARRGRRPGFRKAVTDKAGEVFEGDEGKVAQAKLEALVLNATGGESSSVDALDETQATKVVSFLEGVASQHVLVDVTEDGSVQVDFGEETHRFTRDDEGRLVYVKSEAAE